MEKKIEEIQIRIKKLHYDSTIFDFHYIYLDSDFLLANPSELIPTHLTVILKAAARISNRICLRVVRLPLNTEFKWDEYKDIIRKTVSAIKEIKLPKICYRKSDFFEFTDRHTLIWFSNDHCRHYQSKSGKHLEYKNGRVTETVFEKFEILETIISNRLKCGLIEEKISKSRVRSLLSQASNVAGHVVGDEAVGVRNILSEGIKLLDELGILLFQPYCLRLLKYLTKLNEQNKVLIFEIAITCLRSCFIISRNAIEKSEKKECLISDNLWAAFWLIQKFGVDISNSPVKLTTKNNDNWCPLEDTKPKPSYWSEYCDENIIKSSEDETIVSKSNNFNKWVIQCKCQAAVIELESFLDYEIELTEFPSFYDFFRLLLSSKDEGIDRIFPILPPPKFTNGDFNSNDLETMKRQQEKAEEKIEKHIRAANSDDGHGRNFEKTKGGAIMLMSRDSPNRFNYYTDDYTRPVADFGIRLSHVEGQYAQLPVFTKIWNLVEHVQQGTQVEEVRQQLHFYLRKSNNEIRLDKNDKRKAYRQYINPDFTLNSSKQIQILPEIAKIENPVLEIVKIIKKSCQLTPYASHLIKYVHDPIDKKCVQAIVELPIDFPQARIYRSDFFKDKEEAKQHACRLIISDVKVNNPELYTESTKVNEIISKEAKIKPTVTEIVTSTHYERKFANCLNLADELDQEHSFRSPKQIYNHFFELCRGENDFENKTCIGNYLKSESEKLKKPVAVEPGHMSEFHPLVNRNLYLYEVRIERNKEFVVAQSDGSLQLQNVPKGIEDNEHLIYHPGMSSTKAAKKFGCFGILTGKPLQTIAPFELYDDIKHKQSQDFRNSTLGIIDVTIIPVKSMIQLDKKQILELEHFHRVIALINNIGDATRLRSSREGMIDLLKESNGQFQFDQMRTIGQNFGYLHYLYVPLTFNSNGQKSLQLPWIGYDIDWGLICKMKVFECRQIKIHLAKLAFLQEYDDEERQLKSWRREKVNLSKIETDDPEMAAKIKALALKIEEKEKELTDKYPSKGTVFLGTNPLTKTNQSRKLKKNQFTQLHDKVFFTPWIKADATAMQDISDFIEDQQFPSKMFSSQELERRRKNLYGHHPTLDMDDSKLRSIYPPPDKLYAEIKISSEDGNSRDSTSSTVAKKNITYHAYFCKGYETTDNEGVASFTPPKYPGVTEKNGKLFKVNSYWLNSPRLSKNFLKRQMNNNDNKDEYTEKTNCKYHFFEHLELFFLSRDMLFQSSRLASITIRITQLAKMEEYRQFLAEKCFRENFISYLKENEMHNELDQYENSQNNFKNFNSSIVPSISTNYITWQGFQSVHFDCDVKMKLENASFLQRNIQNPLRLFASEYKSPEFKITVNYDQPVNLPGKIFLKESSHLGLIHPIPIFGSHAYFYPPSMLHVDDKQADDVTFEICSKSRNKDNLKSRENRLSNERELAEQVRKYIPKRIKRCWKVVKGRSSDSIDPEKYCISLFKDKNDKNERITHDDQKSTLPEWNLREDFQERFKQIYSVQPELRKCDVISPDDSNKEDFESHPAYIDWTMIIDQTRSFLRNQTSNEGKIINAISRLKYSNLFHQLIDLIDGDLPKATKTDVDEEKDDLKQYDKCQENNEFWIRFMRKIARDENDINWDRFFIDNDVMGVHSSLLIRCFTQESTGEHWNLTRMEFIGDSFLKLATTRVLYGDPSLDTAGKLTRERTAFIKNLNLIRSAPILELGEFMNVLPLQSSLIYPMFIHSRKIYPEDMDKLGNEPELGNSSSECHWHYAHPYQFMKDDKKLADTVESILGAYLIVGNEKMAARLMLVLDFIHQQFFDRKKTNERSYLVCPEPVFWPEKGENGIKTAFESLPCPTPKEMASVERIESRLKTDKSNFIFENKALARLSLCMPGYDPTCDNDRLEFLGDAVLDYVVAFEYYNNISAYTPAGAHWAKTDLDVGELTAAKQAITSNNTFGSVGFTRFFPHAMLTRDPKFLSLLEDFKSQLRTDFGLPLNPSLGRVFDQLKAILPEKVPLSKSNYLLDLPKWFGDIYEAVFGAIWLDKNQSLSKFWEIAGPQLKPLMRFESHRKEERFKSLNPRKFLDEKADKLRADEPRKLTSEATLESFKLPVEENRAHLGKYAVRVEYEKNTIKYSMVGIGLTKESALFNACYKMLDKINA